MLPSTLLACFLFQCLTFMSLTVVRVTFHPAFVKQHTWNANDKTGDPEPQHYLRDHLKGHA